MQQNGIGEIWLQVTGKIRSMKTSLRDTGTGKADSMNEQGNVLKLLSEHPITETANWIIGEPSVPDLLGDPVIHAVLRRDGLGLNDLLQAIAQGRSRLAPALSTAALHTSDAA